jgi:hypothetical protein
MSCTQLETLLQASVAVQVRVINSFVVGHPPVVTSENAITGFGSQSSVAVANPVTSGPVGSPHCPPASGGHVMIGGVVSLTVIVWVHVAWFPHASVAL